jgi:GSH-dependent disulfide-bond oxidoreductase
MIDSYFVNTPNGRKVSIMLAETALPHRVIRGDRGEVDHLAKEFRKINPNARLPAIVDHDPPGGGGPFAVFESGAILIYLAEKTGQFLSTNPRERSTQIQWVIWQMAGLGPMHGQAHHFARYAPEPVDAYAQQRFTREAERLLVVMNRRLGEAEYLGGDAYSIADMCSWPWINQMNVIRLERKDFPHVNRWFDAVAVRPGVIEGCRFELPKLMKEPGRVPLTPEQFSRGFGDIMHAANRAD